MVDFSPVSLASFLSKNAVFSHVSYFLTIKEHAQLLVTPVARSGVYWGDSIKVWEESVNWLGRCVRFPIGIFSVFLPKNGVFSHVFHFSTMKERAQLFEPLVARWGLYWLDSVKIWEESVHWLGRCGRFLTGLFSVFLPKNAVFSPVFHFSTMKERAQLLEPLGDC